MDWIITGWQAKLIVLVAVFFGLPAIGWTVFKTLKRAVTGKW